MSLIDDARAVLRLNEALLVHFNTPMTRHNVGYPQDLHDAIANPQWEMCYSTILRNDAGPMQAAPATAAACGSVGIVVDLTQATSLLRVHNADAGSNGRGWGAGLGSLPSQATCYQSIAGRTTGHNEWYLSNATPVGIFSFPNPAVFNPGVGETQSSLTAVAQRFPGQRLFTISDGNFYELDHSTGEWNVCAYADIIPP